MYVNRLYLLVASNAVLTNFWPLAQLGLNSFTAKLAFPGPFYVLCTQLANMLAHNAPKWLVGSFFLS